MKKLKRYVRALYSSFYSPSFYLEWIQDGRGFCLGFLFLLCWIGSLPVLSEVFYWSNAFLTKEFIKPLSTFPEVKIEDEVVVFNRMMPYFITNTDQEVVGVIDTTGKIKKINHHLFPHLNWLLTRHTLYYQPVGDFLPPMLNTFIQQNQSMRPFELHMEGAIRFNEVLKAEGIEGKLRFFITAIVFSFPFCLFSMIFIVLCSLTWAAQFFTKVIFHHKLSFSEAFRGLLLALTPVFLIFFWGIAFGYFSVQWTVFLWCLFVVYFSLAVVALKQSHRQIKAQEKASKDIFRSLT